MSVWRGQPQSDLPPGLMHEPQLSLAGHAYQVVQMRVVDEVSTISTSNSVRRSDNSVLIGCQETYPVSIMMVLRANPHQHSSHANGMVMPLQEDQLITADLSGEIRVWELPELTLQQVSQPILGLV